VNDGVAVVTGANGFVGSHLIEALLARGLHPRAVVRVSSDTRWIPSTVERATASLDDAEALGRGMRGARLVFHLAAVTSASRPEDYQRTNVEGTRRVLEAVKVHAPGARVVICSSLAAVGPARGENPLSEEDEPMPVSPYGRSKLDAERVAEAFAAEHQLEILIVRPSAVYGPRDRDILAAFRLASNGIALRVAPADQRLSMIHARDLAQALVLAAERADVRRGSTRRYHVSDGTSPTWSAVTAAIAAAVGRRVITVPMPPAAAFGAATIDSFVAGRRGTKPLITRGRIYELMASNWACDISRARQELAFEPGVPLADGMRETCEWYRAERWLR
jgi:nucleoside-diphosphate-sugar epimerase